jgi:hypothetical protein
VASDYGLVDEIKTKKIGKNIYQTKQKEATRKSLWKYFLAVTAVINDVRRILPFVACTKCEQVLTYDSAKEGTSHSRRVYIEPGLAGPGLIATRADDRTYENGPGLVTDGPGPEKWARADL